MPVIVASGDCRLRLDKNGTCRNSPAVKTALIGYPWFFTTDQRTINSPPDSLYCCSAAGKATSISTTLHSMYIKNTSTKMRRDNSYGSRIPLLVSMLVGNHLYLKTFLHWWDGDLRFIRNTPDSLVQAYSPFSSWNVLEKNNRRIRPLQV